MFHSNRFLNVLIKALFLMLDLIWVRKDPNLWIIAIPASDRFDGNVRAIYELSRNHPELIAPAQIKIIATAKDMRFVRKDSRIPWGSIDHFLTLLRAGCIIFHHNFNDVGLLALPLWRQNFRVSHGIHFKRVERAASVPGFVNRLLLSMRNTIPHHLVSSRLDALAAVSYFHLYLPHVQVTGAAKNDVLISDKLPPFYLHEQDRLTTALAGRKLITYAPTWRTSGESYFFKAPEIERMRDFLNSEKSVLGIAGHAYLRHRHVPEGVEFLDLNALNIDVQVILRNTDTLITDYSSIWIDFLLVRRPIILYQYDVDAYQADRDFLFDVDLFSPGIRCFDFDTLIDALRQRLVGQNDFLRRAFHQYEDGHNTVRSIRAIRNRVRP